MCRDLFLSRTLRWWRIDYASTMPPVVNMVSLSRLNHRTIFTLSEICPGKANVVGAWACFHGQSSASQHKMGPLFSRIPKFV